MTNPIDWASVEQQVLAKLKPFQRRTVEWAFRCLFPVDGRAASGRFLVADEVGLGKTMVARGVLAKTLHHLAERDQRIDVVYVCSNADIARQNLARLTIPNIGQDGFQSQGRLTLMPLIPRGKNGAPVRETALPRNGINFLALTPGTSLDFRNEPGQALERALLAVMVADAIPEVSKIRWRNLFTQQVGHKRFDDLLEQVRNRYAIDVVLQQGFTQAINRRPADGLSLNKRLTTLADRFPRQRSFRSSDEDQREAARLIADLRRSLASVCIQTLQPDLLILDEFQRFQHLLNQHDPSAELARQLFESEQAEHSARVLLLSATPYRMCSLGERSGDAQHHDEFLATVRFLMRGDEAQISTLKENLEAFNDGLRTLDSTRTEPLQRLRETIQTQLSSVMSRTDRTPTSRQRDAMVAAAQCVTYPDAEQMLIYVRLHAVARLLKQPDLVEYWRSAPAPLSFLSGYKLRDELRAALDGQAPALIEALSAPGLFLSSQATPGINPELGHARTAELATELINAGMHRLLWLPPARPSYALGGPFSHISDAARTKRLIFSSWRMVPRAVSTVLDARFVDALHQEYGAVEADRRSEANSDYILGYPSSALAELGHADVLAHACQEDGQVPSIDNIALRVRPAVRALMEAVQQRYGDEPSGSEDHDWYWLGPVLADQLSIVPNGVASAAGEGFCPLDMSLLDQQRDGGSTWQHALHHARSERWRAALDGSHRLGRMPEDLFDVLSRMAVAGPAVCALRSLAADSDDLWRPAVRQAASAIAAAVLHYFDHEQFVRLLGGLYSIERSFWLRALRYCGDGCLQAVLDEYIAVLNDDQPLDPSVDPTGVDALFSRVEHFEMALRLKPAVLRPEILSRDEAGCHRLVPSARSLRYARPLLEDRNDGDGSDGPAPMLQLRSAFNSPFLPFVLSSTSIGQEGLDFHWYCHAIVHWNLPGNPVDFEQRDGRIHRYRNHAVRRNLARDWGGAAQRKVLGARSWDWMFEQATQAVVASGTDSGGIRPAWIYQLGDTQSEYPPPQWMTTHQGGPASIERHVPVIPLSRDVQRLQQMTQAVGTYRMVFAQARQDDLLAHLQRSHAPDVLARVAEDVVIDLRPPNCL